MGNMTKSKTLDSISIKSCKLHDYGYNVDGNPIRIYDISYSHPTILNRSRFKIPMIHKSRDKKIFKLEDVSVRSKNIAIFNSCINSLFYQSINFFISTQDIINLLRTIKRKE